MARSLQISARSWSSHQDGGYLAAISPRFISCKHHSEILVISSILARSRQSRQDLGNLGKMEDISPRSRRDLESKKTSFKISQTSWRDLYILGKILVIAARSRQSRRNLGNLGEISATSARWKIPVSCRNLAEI